MEASLLRVNSVPNHHSLLSASPNIYPARRSSDASVSSSRIAAGVSLCRRRGGGSSSRGSVIARRSAPGDSRSRHAATGGCGGRVRRCEIGDHYRQMLESSPNCSLLLRNYAKYLHEVERDAVRAEKYYATAILSSPGDGEVLSLYGRLIWEAERDAYRAGLYFDQAVNASPDDCMVLGSYAHFLWEAGEEDEEAV